MTTNLLSNKLDTKLSMLQVDLKMHIKVSNHIKTSNHIKAESLESSNKLRFPFNSEHLVEK